VGLLLVSAFFSASETALMTINRYRLRYLAQEGAPSARRVLFLLKRPDRLLATILIGNTFANIVASAIATMLAIHFWGEIGVVLATVVLTLLILILGEIAPKTVAVAHSQKFSFIISGPLLLIFFLLYPIVWLATKISNGLLRLLGVKLQHAHSDRLTSEELRSIVAYSTDKMTAHHQEMLLRILDLEKMTVNDVMTPRNRIVSIDIDDDLETIRQQLLSCNMKYIPVYQDDINEIKGILPVFSALEIFFGPNPDKKTIFSLMKEPYFIPEETLLSTQMKHFKLKDRNHAFVVDEYGDILGLVSLGNIVHEIVGELAMEKSGEEALVQSAIEGGYIVNATIHVRELNRILQVNFPSEGPRTLSGLVTEYLEAMPQAGTCLSLGGCRLEIVEVEGNKISLIKILPKKESQEG
jgi:Mg2+/Co2+ transporter CorB